MISDFETESGMKVLDLDILRTAEMTGHSIIISCKMEVRL